jgi:AcrR family transcriptional regulator
MSDLLPKKRVRLSPDVRRDALLQAAHDLFSRHGFADTRMDDVAAAAGVSKGTVYLYFPTKEALFEALLRRDVLPRVGRILFVLNHYNGPVGWLLKRVAHFIGGKIDAGTVPLYPKLLVREASRFPELARFYHEEVITPVLGALEDLFRRAISRGELGGGDAKLYAHLFIAPMVKAALWYFTFGEISAPAVRARPYLKAHVETFLRGVRP